MIVITATTPAKAGVQSRYFCFGDADICIMRCAYWTPAFAGVEGQGAKVRTA